MSDGFRLSTPQKIIIITAVLASLLEIIDTSIVNVAIPTMMGNLGATLEDISWVVTGYIIANAIVLPIAGWLGVQIGRKKYYVGCILLFTATSVACGLAPNLPVLVVFRIIQGFAGGALLPTSQALIQEQFPRDRAGMANAIYGMGVIVGPTIGPTLGGYLTDNFGWRMIFNINLPLGLIAAFLAFLYVEDIMIPANGGEAARKVERTPIDSIGLLLLMVGVGCFQFVLERGEADDWFSSTMITVCAITALVAIPLFIWWELKTEHPVIDLRLYRNRVVSNGTLLMGTVGMMLYSLIFMIPVFVARVLNYTATETGELFIPGALMTGVMMPFVGNMLRKRDARALILIGVLAVEICILMMTQYNADTGYNELFNPLLIRGIGMAFLFIPINTVVLGDFSGPELGQVAGMLNLSRQLGGSIGIAGLSTLLTRFGAQNRLDLVQKVSLLDPTVWRTFQQIRGSFSSHLQDALGGANAYQLAAKSLEFRIDKQVFIMSFDQMMWVLLIGFFIAVLPLARLKGTHKVTGPVSAH